MKQEHEWAGNTLTSGALPSVLAALRAMAPVGQLTWSRALRLAEDQADRLLELSHITAAPVPDNIIRRLPRIQVRLSSLPTSGVTYWDGEHWIVGLNQTEPRTRRRFTLVHEYKHIVDHGRTAQLYAGDRFHSSLQQAERAADYFGGCVLMPRALVEEAWHAGLQTAAEIAEGFDVSTRAAEVRLAQLGLSAQPTSHPAWTRDSHPGFPPRRSWYERSARAVTQQGSFVEVVV